MTNGVYNDFDKEEFDELIVYSIEKQFHRETFDEPLAIHQIHQSFPLSNFCAIKYIMVGILLPYIDWNIIIFVLLGYLCGQCHNGKGVSALLNKCVSCGNASILLIIALGRQYVVCIVHVYVCYIIISHS